MFSGSVDAGFILALPFDHGEHEPDCVEVATKGEGGGGAEREARGGEMLPMLGVGWRASALRGEKAERFREVAGVSIIAAGDPRSQQTI